VSALIHSPIGGSAFSARILTKTKSSSKYQPKYFHEAQTVLRHDLRSFELSAETGVQTNQEMSFRDNYRLLGTEHFAEAEDGQGYEYI